MNIHPKPIARYKLVTHDVHASAFPDDEGKWVKHDDHEAALAAEREQYEARIAELEREQENSFAMLEMYGVPRERAKRVSNGIDVLATRYGKLDRIHSMTVQELNALRTAIEAMAREWKEYGSRLLNDNHYATRAIGRCAYECAAELLALSEKKP